MELAEVLIGRVLRKVGRPNRNRASRRIYFAAQNIVKHRKSSLARMTEGENCVDFEFSRQKFGQLKRRGAFEYDDHLIADLLGKSYGILFILRQRKIVRRAVVVRIVLFIRAFGAFAGKEYKSRSACSRCALVYRRGIFVKFVNVTHSARRFIRHKSPGRSVQSLWIGHILYLVVSGIVHGESFFQCLFGRNRILGQNPLCRTARTRLPVNGRLIAEAERRNGASLRQRQNAVVLQKHRTLFLDTKSHLIRRLGGFRFVGELILVISGVPLVAPLGDNVGSLAAPQSVIQKRSENVCRNIYRNQKNCTKRRNGDHDHSELERTHRLVFSHRILLL